MFIYSLFDRKMKEYGLLVRSKTDESARRDLLDTLRGSGVIVEKYPEDFDLMVIGTFDEETGILVGTSPRLVCNVSDLIGGRNVSVSGGLKVVEDDPSGVASAG